MNLEPKPVRTRERRPRGASATILATTDAPRRSTYAHATILASAIIGVFLAGGPQQGSLGIFLLLAGAGLIAFPPTAHVPWRLWIAAGALLGCSALALLPHAWFPTPTWRLQLRQSPAIALPPSVSPAPWETGFWLAVLAISICIGLFLLSHPVRSKTMLALATVGAALCAAYSALAITAQLTGWVYPFDGGPTFGFFPNRNHTAAFLVTGTLLAMAVLGVAYRRRQWAAGAVATAALTLCLGGLGLFSDSRGGVVFAVLGAIIWVAGLGSLHRDRRLLAYVAGFSAAAAISFLIFGGGARDRLWTGFHPAAEHKTEPLADGDPEEKHSLSLDGRMLIYRDAAQMLRESPFTGVGLGVFPLVSAQYQRAALFETAAAHPESDWLMLADEAGIPALGCALILVGLLTARLAAQRSHAFWPLRWGCFVAAAAALLHGAVDVPLHRVTLGWWILAIAGLALQPGRKLAETPSRLQRWVFAAAGIGALALGGLLVRGEWFGGSALPPFAGRQALAQAYRAYQDGNQPKAVELSRRGLQRSPLFAPLYYQAGAFSLSEGNATAVDRLFDAERRLRPHWPRTPLLQAKTWLNADPQRAVTLWTDAIDRRLIIDQAAKKGLQPALAMFSSILLELQTRPDVQQLLWREAARDTPFMFTWIENVAPEVAIAGLTALAGDEPFLRTLTPTERLRFVRDWEGRGGSQADGLAEFVAAHPDWDEATCRFRMRRLAAERQFEEAVRCSSERYGVSLALPEVTTGAKDAQAAGAGPDDAKKFNALWAQGHFEAAARLLESMRRTDPAEYWRLSAATAVSRNDWPSAWAAVDQHLQLTHRF